MTETAYPEGAGWTIPILDKASSICHPSRERPFQERPRKMEYDIELLRELMFSLEERQQSPRTTVVLSLIDEAVEFGHTPAQIEGSLDVLLGLQYIDGGGHDEQPGYWLFRKLTRKGTEFVRSVREPRDWERMKRHFARRRVEER